MAARKKRTARRKSATQKKARANKRTKAEPAGEVLQRTYKGEVHKVVLTPEGFRYAGQDYGSLTSVAKHITGYKSISGPRFFAPAKGGDDAA